MSLYHSGKQKSITDHILRHKNTVFDNSINNKPTSVLQAKHGRADLPL